MVIKNFKRSQNLAFARFARKIYTSARLLVLAKVLQLLACSDSLLNLPDFLKCRKSVLLRSH